MANLLFVTWNGGGNQAPAQGLALELRNRGHGVQFLGQESQRKRFEADGFPFTSFIECPYTQSSTASAANARVHYFLHSIWLNDVLFEDVVSILDHEPIDCLIVDSMLIGILERANSLSIPTIAFLSSVFFASLDLRNSMVALGNLQRKSMGRALLDEERAKWESQALVLITGLREFDAPSSSDFSNVRYIGPIRALNDARSSWQSPWDSSDQRPLIVVSYSTNSDQTSAAGLQATLDALEGIDARVLLTTGGAVSPMALRSPANTHVVGFVPHELVLDEASVMITHGGHGSVMAALSRGVPLVCVPSLGADQPLIAARIEALGLGRALHSDPDGPTLAAAVREVLNQPHFKVECEKFKQLIEGSGGAVQGAKEIERVVKHHKVSREAKE